jgi:hypothetical protein
MLTDDRTVMLFIEAQSIAGWLLPQKAYLPQKIKPAFG